MRILLDECLPRKIKLEIIADAVLTVPEAGWASKKNGDLLRLAEANFDVFLTTDQNLEYQQNVTSFDLAIIVLVAPTNDINDLKPLMPQVRLAVESVKPGEVIYIK